MARKGDKSSRQSATTIPGATPNKATAILAAARRGAKGGSWFVVQLG
jgi:hypothetical protein